MIRRAFEAEMRRRFAKLRTDLWDFMVDKDALGLGPRNSFVALAQKREFEFKSNSGKLEAFNSWLQQQMQASILSAPPGTPAGQPWMAKYVESAWKKGVVGAYASAKKKKVGAKDMSPSQERFLRDAFAQPERLSKVRLLATRSYEDLKGMTSSMGSKLNRILAQGMIDGKNPRELAKQMTSQIKGMEKKQALTIARTEVIHAHAEGQLDGFEELGVDELGVQAEWSTAGDDRVCPKCSGYEGETFSVDEARGMIPLHPNCRCSWVPSFSAPKPRRTKRR